MNQPKLFITLILLACIARLISLGTYPLMDKTEARYAEIGREMVATQNWVTPQLEQGLPFWGKPPLSFWLTAISFQLLGEGEFSARLPSFLLAILMLYFTYLLGKHLINPKYGLMAGCILATTGMFFVNAGSVMTDPALSTAITLSMISLIFCLQSPHPSKYWGYLFFIGLALSLLAKGPVGAVLIFIPIVLWLIIYRQWKRLWLSLPWITGLLLTALIAIPWYVLAEMKTPGFLNYFIVGEHFKRFTVSGWEGDLYGKGHSQPKGMIWLFAIPVTMPWTIIMVGALMYLKKAKVKFKAIFENEIWILILLWLLSPLILFTIASNILMTYLIPALPAFALITARLILLLEKQQSKPLSWPAKPNTFLITSLLAPLALIIAAITILPSVGRQSSQVDIVNKYKELRPDVASQLVYVDHMPYSADFYAQGSAVDTPIIEHKYYFPYLKDNKKDFFAINDDNIYDLPRELFLQTKKVATFYNYSLYQEQ